MQRLEMRQGQSLVMTPQLLQAIKLLQLSHVDLAAYVDAELERNPLLDRSESEHAEDSEGSAEPAETPDTGPDVSDSWQLESGQHLDSTLDGTRFDEAPLSPRGPADGDVLPLHSQGSAGGSWGLDGEGRDLEATLAGETTLREHLVRQLELATADAGERLIGRHLIDAVNEAGYLTEPVEAIAEGLGAPLRAVEAVLAMIHRLDPTGVGARNLAECLALQLQERNRCDPAMRALLTRLDLAAARDVPALRRLCGVDEDDVRDMLAEIRRLDPKPGRAFGSDPLQVLVPDVIVRPTPDGDWAVELNPQTLPRVLVNQSYYARASKLARLAGEKAFLSDCWQTAHWLARSLDQRAKTVLKVAVEIVRQQDAFFRHGVAHLRPLTLKTVADAIAMHESTVSRVTSNKAIGTNRGTFEMKYFFTAAIPGAGGAEAHSAEAVRHRIKRLIDGETAADALSDDSLVQKLRDDGVEIARRTVAKYRESLRIPSSVERRRLGSCA